MSRITRARLNEEAAYLEAKAIPRTLAAARDGERAAADPSTSDYQRSVAGACARIARARAADYRNFAETLRAGEIPDGMDLD
ncbi:hypothetical protein [Streptomyces uncialis]|uniref:hypothetical protein n=1 Tax=Streptomyces uncialis TaxID=1048205 RepID=UPI002259102F|nr:hypothetical protein [Streptomyces uncialis]MCX4665044.1 hypothetical protein [Streptomyces uncialis]